jgi:hypothetical protein
MDEQGGEGGLKEADVYRARVMKDWERDLPVVGTVVGACMSIHRERRGACQKAT